MKTQVLRGSVVFADTDAIVNAANEQLAAGGGVCGAIFEAAGYNRLTKACSALAPCPTGQAAVTPGYDLKARYIIHAVGPIYRGRAEDAELLASAYRSILRAAEGLGCRSVGLCSLSTGIYGYPLEDAARIAAQVFADWQSDTLTDIRMYCYGQREFEAFTRLLAK